MVYSIPRRVLSMPDAKWEMLLLHGYNTLGRYHFLLPRPKVLMGNHEFLNDETIV